MESNTVKDHKVENLNKREKKRMSYCNAAAYISDVSFLQILFVRTIFKARFMINIQQKCRVLNVALPESQETSPR